MIIWLASYPRSGVTFARIALHHLFGISSKTVYPIADDRLSLQPVIGGLPAEMSLAEIAAASELCFVKTHEMPGEDQWPAIYLVRDGRDALVSYAHYLLYTQRGIPPGSSRTLFLDILKELIVSDGHCGAWGRHVLAWTRRAALCHVVRFEDLIVKPGEELGQALATVGGRPLVEGGAPMPSFPELHGAVPWFYRKGKVGAWREEMPGNLHELFWQHHREAMEALGYGDPGRDGPSDSAECGHTSHAPNASTPGLAYFFSPHYAKHNRAVLIHLESLGLPLSNCRVLELGSGPGDHTGFYVQRKCAIVSVDSRQACLDMLIHRFPGVATVLCDLNDPACLRGLGTFDVIHCYGILYHLERPADLISYLGEACSGLAVVQTCVSTDAHDQVVTEDSGDYTQSSTGRGCRPTRKWVFEQLGRVFPFVYSTKTQPPDPEFPVNWNNLTEAPPLVRAVFVASKHPLDHPALRAGLVDDQEHLVIGEEEAPSIAPGRLRDLISAFATIWAEGEQRARVLEAAAAERLAAVLEKEEVIARLHAEIASRDAASEADSN